MSSSREASSASICMIAHAYNCSPSLFPFFRREASAPVGEAFIHLRKESGQKVDLVGREGPRHFPFDPFLGGQKGLFHCPSPVGKEDDVGPAVVETSGPPDKAHLFQPRQGSPHVGAVDGEPRDEVILAAAVVAVKEQQEAQLAMPHPVGRHLSVAEAVHLLDEAPQGTEKKVVVGKQGSYLPSAVPFPGKIFPASSATI